MAIEDWGIEAEPVDTVDDPRRHTLGGFRPGEGFRPSDEDETLTSLEFESDDAVATAASAPVIPGSEIGKP